MQFSKIKYVLILLFFVKCTYNNTIFKKVIKYNNIHQLVSLNKDGFYGLKEQIKFNKKQYKRYIYIFKKDIIIDGYFNKQNDSLLFIPYQTIYNGCKINPLLFCRFNNYNSHYLGYSCTTRPFTVQTTIIVKYDSKNSCKNELYFSHTALSDDDFMPGHAPILEVRYYKMDLKTGLKLDSIKCQSDMGLYWWNY